MNYDGAMIESVNGLLLLLPPFTSRKFFSGGTVTLSGGFGSLGGSKIVWKYMRRILEPFFTRFKISL